MKGVAPEWVVVRLAAEQADARAHAQVLDAPGYAVSSLSSLVGAQMAPRAATALLKILVIWVLHRCERGIATLLISNNNCGRRLLWVKLLLKYLIWSV